ncbi:MAG: hypothetical protein KKC79_03310 [Gammaproteobacteria bacterium]|nr:hypothetical protein [Gammaproteobacteria bacterium]
MVGANAAELELEGNRLLVTGVLDGSGLAAFNEHLATGKVRTVVFENSLGGTAEAASEYARAIAASGVNTEAKGQCHAACAYAFLAGKEHRFGRGPTVNGLLIPLVARPRPDELANRWRGDEMHRTLAEFVTPASQGTEPAPVAVANAGNERWQPARGVLFTSSPTLFGRVYNTFYCDGSQGRDMSKCEYLADADPFKLGVLTPWPAASGASPPPAGK